MSYSCCSSEVPVSHTEISPASHEIARGSDISAVGVPTSPAGLRLNFIVVRQSTYRDPTRLGLVELKAKSPNGKTSLSHLTAELDFVSFLYGVFSMVSSVYCNCHILLLYCDDFHYVPRKTTIVSYPSA